MKLAAYLLLLFIPALAQTAPIKVVTSDCPPAPNQPMPFSERDSVLRTREHPYWFMSRMDASPWRSCCSTRTARKRSLFPQKA